MNSSEQEKLISAYVDGQLEADDQLRAEQLLAESEEARQLLSEFRALGETLRSLPSVALGAEFSDEVLRQAQRAKVSIADPQEETSHHEPRTWRRSIVWSCLAVAAAILVMVFTPDADRHELAQGDAALESTAGDKERPRTTQMKAAPSDDALTDKDAMFDDESPDAAQGPSIAMESAAGSSPREAADSKLPMPAPPVATASEFSPSDDALASPGSRRTRNAPKGKTANTPSPAATKSVDFPYNVDAVVTLRSNKTRRGDQREMIDRLLRKNLEEKVQKTTTKAASGQSVAQEPKETALAANHVKKADDRSDDRLLGASKTHEMRYTIEGTYEQLVATLARLQTEDPSIQWVSANPNVLQPHAELDPKATSRIPEGDGDKLEYDAEADFGEGRRGDTRSNGKGSGRQSSRVRAVPSAPATVAPSRDSADRFADAAPSDDDIGPRLRRSLRLETSIPKPLGDTATESLESGNLEGVSDKKRAPSPARIYRIVVVVQFDDLAVPTTTAPAPTERAEDR